MSLALDERLFFLAGNHSMQKNTDCISAEGYDSPKEFPMAQLVGVVKNTDSISEEG